MRQKILAYFKMPSPQKMLEYVMRTRHNTVPEFKDEAFTLLAHLNHFLTIVSTVNSATYFFFYRTLI